MAQKRLHLTPDLLRRYAAGELTPAEQHNVERQLLDDPLLAEAVEGLARMREDGVEATADLPARLQQRVNRRGRVVPLAWARYAAAATVLLAVAGLGWWALREEPIVSSPETAVSTSAPSPPEVAPATAPASAPPPEAANAPTAPPQAVSPGTRRNLAAQPDVQADEAASPPVASSARVAVAPPADSVRAEAPPAEIAAQSSRAERPREAPTPAAARSAPAGTSRALTGPRFTGRVLGVNQEPVAGATVVSVTTRQSVRTDDLGKFSLPETSTGDRLRIAAPGYQPLEVAVRDTAVGTLNLQPAPAAHAKAVAPAAPRPGEDGLEPRFPAFDDYVRAHRRVAGQGTVRLSFRLGPGGKPRQVRVEASDNPALNAEALRLLREGPGWSENKTTRRKGRVVYVIRFE